MSILALGLQELLKCVPTAEDDGHVEPSDYGIAVIADSGDRHAQPIVYEQKMTLVFEEHTIDVGEPTEPMSMSSQQEAVLAGSESSKLGSDDPWIVQQMYWAQENPGALVERQKEWTEQKLLYYFVFQLTSPVLGAIAAQSSAAGELTREVLINLLTADPDEPHHLPVMVGPVSRIDKARKVVRTVARGQKVVKSARRSKAATRIVQGAARLTKEQKKVVDTVEEAYQFVIEGFMKRAKRLPKGEKVEPHEIGTWADKIVKDWLRKDLAKRKVFRGLEIHSDVRVGIGRIDIDLYFPKLKLAIELKKSVKAVKARQATAQSTIPDNINFPPGTVVVTLFGH